MNKNNHFDFQDSVFRGDLDESVSYHHVGIVNYGVITSYSNEPQRVSSNKNLFDIDQNVRRYSKSIPNKNIEHADHFQSRKQDWKIILPIAAFLSFYLTYVTRPVDSGIMNFAIIGWFISWWSCIVIFLKKSNLDPLLFERRFLLWMLTLGSGVGGFCWTLFGALSPTSFLLFTSFGSLVFGIFSFGR